MMPAMRAAPSTSPFLGVALAHDVEGFLRHQNAALCDRDALGRRLREDINHAGFAARGGKCESFFPSRDATASSRRGERRRVGRKQRTRCPVGIVLAHQAFADQECGNTGLRASRARSAGAKIPCSRRPRYGRRGNEAAPAARRSTAWSRRSSGSCCRCRSDAISGASARLQLFLVVDFNQHVHAKSRALPASSSAAHASSTAAMMIRMQSAPAGARLCDLIGIVQESPCATPAISAAARA